MFINSKSKQINKPRLSCNIINLEKKGNITDNTNSINNLKNKITEINQKSGMNHAQSIYYTARDFKNRPKSFQKISNSVCKGKGSFIKEFNEENLFKTKMPRTSRETSPKLNFKGVSLNTNKKINFPCKNSIDNYNSTSNNKSSSKNYTKNFFETEKRQNYTAPKTSTNKSSEKNSFLKTESNEISSLENSSKEISSSKESYDNRNSNLKEVVDNGKQVTLNIWDLDLNMLKDIFDRMDDDKSNLLTSSRLCLTKLNHKILEALEEVIVAIYTKESSVDFKSFCKLVIELNTYKNLESVYTLFSFLLFYFIFIYIKVYQLQKTDQEQR